MLVHLDFDLLIVFFVSRDPEDSWKIEVFAEVLLMRWLLDHDAASFIVSLSVFDHVGACVDPLEAIDSEIVHKEEHQTTIV